jgi:hypothetical protein
MSHEWLFSHFLAQFILLLQVSVHISIHVSIWHHFKLHAPVKDRLDLLLVLGGELHHGYLLAGVLDDVLHPHQRFQFIQRPLIINNK